MKIGILTYYRVANFGANLQALSTYKYLENCGYEPIMIHYMSSELYEKTDAKRKENVQIDMHLSFVDQYMPNHTNLCFTSEDINREITKYNIDAIIVGADAVLQHHPIIARLKIKGRRIKRFYVEKVGEERLFPNLFWGKGIQDNVKMVLMSVSSQNSRYQLYDPITKIRMHTALKRYAYMSVRDEWTKNLLGSIGYKGISITPDPVFAFNQNVGKIILSKEQLLRKYNLPEDYVLISFLNYPLPLEQVMKLQKLYANDGITMVALPNPLGIQFQHNCSKEIPLPLSPLDWYALIAYSKGYIGNNMHPIIVALHNDVPCFSIDNYQNYDIHNKPIDDHSSKIYDVFRRFGLTDFYMTPEQGIAEGSAAIIYECMKKFPFDIVRANAQKRTEEYDIMMKKILKAIAK